MESRREEQPQAPPSAYQKPKRFRIVKLEDRIAPKTKSTAGTPGCATYTCNNVTYTCTSCEACW